MPQSSCFTNEARINSNIFVANQHHIFIARVCRLLTQADHTSSLTRGARSPVGVDCMSNNPLPLSPVGFLPSQCVQVLLAPIRDIIRPFSTWSTFPCFALHHTKHYGFWHSCVLHPANVAKELEFSQYYDLKYVSVGSNALLHFFIPDFLLPLDVQNPPSIRNVYKVTYLSK